MPGLGQPTSPTVAATSASSLELTDLNLDGFERVIRITESQTGLRAYVALHSLALGPGLGGCRLFPYPSEAAAIADVCALARGMSYKNALAGIPFGGGKAVIVGDQVSKTPERLTAFAEALNRLNGSYLTAEDSGIGTADMAIMAETSAHVAGAGGAERAGGGNPAPFTARGVFDGLRVAVATRLETTNLHGLVVGVEGLGQVGWELTRLLRAAGASVLGTDIDPRRLRRAATELGITAVEPGKLLEHALDVFAPCALGGAVSLERLPQLTAPVICGAANNQLESVALGDILARRQQLYAPDYVVNAGGVISIAGEYLDCWSPAWVDAQIDRISVTLKTILERASSGGLATSLVADRRAREVIRNASPSPLARSA